MKKKKETTIKQMVRDINVVKRDDFSDGLDTLF